MLASIFTFNHIKYHTVGYRAWKGCGERGLKALFKSTVVNFITFIQPCHATTRLHCCAEKKHNCILTATNMPHGKDNGKPLSSLSSTQSWMSRSHWKAQSWSSAAVLNTQNQTQTEMEGHQMRSRLALHKQAKSAVSGVAKIVSNTHPFLMRKGAGEGYRGQIISYIQGNTLNMQPQTWKDGCNTVRRGKQKIAYVERLTRRTGYLENRRHKVPLQYFHARRRGFTWGMSEGESRRI